MHKTKFQKNQCNWLVYILTKNTSYVSSIASWNLLKMSISALKRLMKLAGNLDNQNLHLAVCTV